MELVPVQQGNNMTYSNTVIKDFADCCDNTPPAPNPYIPPAVKPTVFQKPKFYPVDDVKKRRAELVALREKLAIDIERIDRYLEAVG